MLFAQPLDGKGEDRFRGRPDGNRPRSAEFGKSALDRDLARITKEVRGISLSIAFSCSRRRRRTELARRLKWNQNGPR